MIMTSKDTSIGMDTMKMEKRITKSIDLEKNQLLDNSLIM